MSEIKTFLSGLKEIGRSKSEIKKVQSKIQSYTGKLYRYRPLPNTEQLEKDTQLTEQIKYRIAELKGQIFLQTREKLNDPMDMYLRIKSTDYKSLIQAYKKNPTEFAKEFSDKGFTDDEIKKIIKLSPNKADKFIRDKLTSAFKYGASNLDNFCYDSISDGLNKMNHINSFNRIACFTETYNNMPMWSSYTNNYQGICLEYNIEQTDILQKIFPAIYTDNLPDMYDVYSKLEIRDGIPFVAPEYQLLWLLFKTNDWSYEKEWRYIEGNYDNIDNILGDFAEEFLDKLPYEEQNEILNKISKIENPYETPFVEMVKLFPQHFMEEFQQFFLNLPVPQGKIVDFKPCRIYLGHNIIPEYEKEFRKLAEQLDIEVLKMSLQPTGYQAISIEEADKQKAQIFTQEAMKLFDNQQYDDAIVKCNESNDIYRNFWAYIYLGLCYSKKNILELALENYKRAIEIEPNHPVGHSNAGQMYFKMKKYDMAIKEYLLFLPQWSNKANVYINLVIAYIYQSMYDDAIKTIKDALIKCTDFAKELCEDSDFTESLKNNSSFIDSIHKEPTLSEISEFINGIKRNEE